VLTRAVELLPAVAAPRYHQSRALIELGRLDEAARQIRQALQLLPSAGMAASLHAQLGLIAYIRKDDNAALASFQEALRLDPQHWPARKNAGIALGNLGRNAEAIEQLQSYLAANPEDKEIAGAIAALRAGK
jgi:tetratricopeptide (TPR) repeat protein